MKIQIMLNQIIREICQFGKALGITSIQPSNTKMVSGRYKDREICYKYSHSRLIYSLGKSYFFKGKKFWKLDDASMTVTRREPHSSAHRWMGCPRSGTKTNEVYENELEHKEPLVASAPKHVISFLLIFGAAVMGWNINC